MCCTSEGNKRDGYHKYKQFVSQFPTAAVSRCFAVEPILDELLEDELRDNLIVIPNQHDKLGFYMETLVNDIAAELLKVFEARASIVSPLFSGHHSIEVFKASNDANIHKRKLVRTYKLYADHALLAGDFTDALESYLYAVEMTRGYLDELEQAGSLEGAASALCFATFDPYRPIDETTKQTQVEQIIQYCTEAIALYEKTNQHILIVELLFKLGGFCAVRGGKSKRVFVLDCMNRIFVRIGGFKMMDRAVLCAMVGKTCSELGFKRKAGMFLRDAALAQLELKNATLAKRLISYCFKAYDLPLVYDDWSGWRIAEEKLSSVRSNRREGWSELQLQLILDFLNISNSKNSNGRYGDIGIDRLAQAQLILFLFSRYHRDMDADLQQKLFDHLCDISQTIGDAKNACLLPLPFLLQVVPEKLPTHLDPIAKESLKPRKSVFIFNPFDKDKNASRITYVVGEPTRIRIVLRNPLSIHLKLRKIGFLFNENSVPCEVVEENCLLHSRSSLSLNITLTPLKAGTLSIDAVQFQFANCHLRADNLVMPWRPRDDKQAEITVIDPIPLLQVTQSNETISLYDGQNFQSTLLLENTGLETIEDVSIEVKNRSPSCLIIDEQVIKRSLPLRPNESTSISVSFKGKLCVVFLC